MKERLYFFYSFKRLRIKPGIALLLKISSSREATNIPFNKWKLEKTISYFFTDLVFMFFVIVALKTRSMFISYQAIYSNLKAGEKRES